MRRIISIIMLIMFVLLSVSGIQLIVAPKNKPQQIQQQMMNSGQNQFMNTENRHFYPKEAHEWAGIIFIVVGVIHLVINRKPMLSYLKPRGK